MLPWRWRLFSFDVLMHGVLQNCEKSKSFFNPKNHSYGGRKCWLCLQGRTRFTRSAIFRLCWIPLKTWKTNEEDVKMFLFYWNSLELKSGSVEKMKDAYVLKNKVKWRQNPQSKETSQNFWQTLRPMNRFPKSLHKSHWIFLSQILRFSWNKTSVWFPTLFCLSLLFLQKIRRLNAFFVFTFLTFFSILFSV